jgi:hypothetical protein
MRDFSSFGETLIVGASPAIAIAPGQTVVRQDERPRLDVAATISK